MTAPSGKPEAQALLDAPPAYDTSESSSSSRPAPAEKASGLKSPALPPSPSSEASSANWGSRLGKLGAEWIKAHEVRKTVKQLLRDLVQNQTTDSNASGIAILDSCSEACAQNDVNMRKILQRADIEGHTALYWAIVMRPADPSEAQRPPLEAEMPPLVRTLLVYAVPLKPETVMDIRHACLHASDQWLFQCLRCRPDVSRLPNKDQLLLRVEVPPDTVTIHASSPSDAALCTVSFTIAEFQKRMRITHAVTLEFISHSRMWELSFFNYETGTTVYDAKSNTYIPAGGNAAGKWVVRLILRDTSPSANITLARATVEPQTVEPGDAKEPLEVMKSSGSLDVSTELRQILPDILLYPHTPYLASDGTLRGKLVIQLANSN
ncbi:hypothetical protein C8F01DRAFT_1255858 [Mycena amicta]|nr:hypothetical protein C8F01DRAFT_1255858 [Mycena amicta]